MEKNDKNHDEDSQIEGMLGDMGGGEYPEDLLAERRAKFVGSVRRKKNRSSCTTWLIILLIILVVILCWLSQDNFGVYNGLNKGVFFLNCGLEIVGEPGLFCNPG